MGNVKDGIDAVDKTLTGIEAVTKSEPDTTFTTTYAKGIEVLTPTFGRTGVTTETVTVPKSKVDSVLTSAKQKDAAAAKNLQNKMDEINNRSN
jgi:hypothetical protein